MIATRARAEHNDLMTEHGDRYASEFTGHDRRRLRQAMQRAASARLFRRLQAVLRVAEGESIAQAARGAGVDRSTVHRWVQRYQQSRRVEDLADVPSSGRPPQADELDEALLAQVLAEDPHEHGLDEALLAQVLAEDPHEHGLLNQPTAESDTSGYKY